MNLTINLRPMSPWMRLKAAWCILRGREFRITDVEVT